MTGMANPLAGKPFEVRKKYPHNMFKAMVLSKESSHMVKDWMERESVWCRLVESSDKTEFWPVEFKFTQYSPCHAVVTVLLRQEVESGGFMVEMGKGSFRYFDNADYFREFEEIPDKEEEERLREKAMLLQERETELVKGELKLKKQAPEEKDKEVTEGERYFNALLQGIVDGEEMLSSKTTMGLELPPEVVKEAESYLEEARTYTRSHHDTGWGMFLAGTQFVERARAVIVQEWIRQRPAKPYDMDKDNNLSDYEKKFRRGVQERAANEKQKGGTGEKS